MSDGARGRTRTLQNLKREITACRICSDTPSGRPLPHAPRPVVVPSATARIAVCGQAPGARVHASGIPFSDPSGDRLRAWMGVTPGEFYDPQWIAIIPMGFCFPGYDAKGGDLPPRKECASVWHARLFAAMPQLDLVLLVGSYAQAWHLGKDREASLTATVAGWRRYLAVAGPQRKYIPLPHPSWRNTGWLKSHPWFEAEVVPALRHEVRKRLTR